MFDRLNDGALDTYLRGGHGELLRVTLGEVVRSMDGLTVTFPPIIFDRA